MRRNLVLKRFARVTVTSIALAAATGAAKADSLPAYMQPIAGHTTSSPAETATKNVLALNSGMFELYGDAAKIFQSNILNQHPVILGLFSGAGGRFILYRPGQAPLEAPSVPVVYQLLKSIDHSTMGLIWTIPTISPGAARCSPIGAGRSRRWMALTRRPCLRSGGRTTGSSLRTISHSWTSV
jgi:hypothetical protein